MKLGISCICLTYGRVNFLEEAIQSFLKQDYPKDRCELIIVNDYSLQTLIYEDVPNIRILNVMTPFDSIGAKVQFAINQSKFNVIATWDDDDIALPNHLSNIDKYFVKDTHVLHWAKGGFWNEPELTSISWIGNSGVVYTKEAIKLIGGVPLENAGYDTTMVDKIHSLGIERTIFCTPTDEETAWYYRWGFVSKPCYHQSGQGTDDESKPNILVRHAMHIEQLRINGEILTGDIKLNPHWIYDYEQQLKDYLIKNKDYAS
jgi:glycosyltransferase involved in cell wall biosynthesis